MTMEKWQATTEMTMTTTNDKKMKKWQKDRQFQPTLMGTQNWQYEKNLWKRKEKQTFENMLNENYVIVLIAIIY